AEGVELRGGHEAGRLGALEPDELLELPDRRVRDEIELFPQVVQLALLAGVEYELVQRPIVAEIAHLTVETGAQQTVALRIGCDLAGVGQEDAAALGDVKLVGEQSAETREGRVVTRPGVVCFWNQQGRIGWRVRRHVQLQRVARISRSMIGEL